MNVILTGMYKVLFRPFSTVVSEGDFIKLNWIYYMHKRIGLGTNSINNYTNRLAPLIFFFLLLNQLEFIVHQYTSTSSPSVSVN